MISTSTADDPRRAIDPDNRLLWHAHPKRMEAETVRDSVLSVAGQLDATVGGADLAHGQGLSVPRRSLYFQHANEKQMTFLKLFDVASVNECYRRSESVVPQQACALRIARSRSSNRGGWRQACGKKTSAPSDGAAERFVGAAFEQILSRFPRPRNVLYRRSS